MANLHAEISDQDARIDLTPMLDVVFIMLIFFIVTASFVREISIELETPPKSTSSGNDLNPNVIVNLKSDNQIYIEGRRIDGRSLRAYFERHRAEHPEAALIIRAESNAKTHAVVLISDAAREANILQVVLQNINEKRRDL